LTLISTLLAVLPVASKSGQTTTSEFHGTRIFKGQISNDDTAGEKALLSGGYAEAASRFRKALNKNSRDLPAICGLGFALALQFKLDGAEQQFNQALKLKADDPLAHAGMALVKLNRLQSSSMTIIKQRDAILTSAESDCMTALRSEPNLPVALIVLGLVKKEQGDSESAKANFSKAISFDPKYGTAYVNRGLIEMKQGDTASAITDFKEAIALNSANSTAHYALGKAYTQLGQLDKAYSELNTALSLKSNSAPAHIAMGEVYRLQGNSVAAIKEFKAAIAIKAESEEAYLKLASLYEGRGDLEMAAADLRSGLALSPDNLDLHRRLGDICLRLGKSNDALTEYTTVLTSAPGDVAAVDGMTRALVQKTEKEAQGAYFLSNNYESAESYIQKAISMNPNNLQLRLADAKLKAMSGQPVDLTSVGTPTNDAERIGYAEAAMAQFKFQDASQAMTTVINNCQTTEQLFAVADMALLTRDLDSAEMAYKRGGTMPGPDVAARSQRGLVAVSDARQKSQQELTLAKDLSSRNQLASAIDRYRSAAYLNPRLANAHLGLAEATEKFQKKDAAALREASLHYNAYLSLQTNLPEKEREKIAKRAEKCRETAYKIDQGHPASNLASLLQPVGTIGRKVGTGIKDIF
jgi:tetratricopeptide (TPR) repeat protein